MTLYEKIKADFMVAFKAKEMEKKNFLGVIKGEIQKEEGRGVEATDDNVLKVIRAMEKSLIQTGTEDALKELEYIKPYLPQLMSEDEVRKNIAFYLSICDDGFDNIGGIMKFFKEKFSGKVDNKTVARVAKEMIS